MNALSRHLVVLATDFDSETITLDQLENELKVILDQMPARKALPEYRTE